MKLKSVKYEVTNISYLMTNRSLERKVMYNVKSRAKMKFDILILLDMIRLKNEIEIS